MKKIYLAIISFLFFCFTKLEAQVCTPNVSCLNSSQTYGFCPDTITNLPPAYVNTPYSTSISFKVPANGQDWGYPLVTVSKVEIYKNGATGTYSDGFINLPSWVTYQCSGTGGKCEWNGGTTGCVLLSGTPTTTGLYKIKVVVKAYALGGTLSLLDTAYGYKIEVLPQSSAGLTTLSTNKFEVAQNYPNPVNSETTIGYYSIKSSPVTFKLYDVLGKVIFTFNTKPIIGYNEIKLDVRDLHLKPGIYIYSLTNGTETITRRMLVTN
jgi:hypothetical protein